MGGGIQQWLNRFRTLSRPVSSRPLLQFLDALLLSKAGQTPMFTGNTLNPFALENGFRVFSSASPKVRVVFRKFITGGWRNQG